MIIIWIVVIMFCMAGIIMWLAEPDPKKWMF